jgi:programmed cell death protein 5
MNNITPANIDPKELDLPDGFTSADPNATGGGSTGGGKSEAQGKEEQKQAILQQALTPDALARLRRIKVRCR